MKNIPNIDQVISEEKEKAIIQRSATNRVAMYLWAISLLIALIFYNFISGVFSGRIGGAILYSVSELLMLTLFIKYAICLYNNTKK